MQEVKPDTTNEMKSNLGGSPNVVFSFDTTGSMASCIQQVRQKLRDLIEMMSADIPGLKIGLIAHGDYCDGDDAIAFLDLTDDLEKIMTFINSAPNTCGGDSPECYEYALQTARKMSWPKEGGSVVLIGDDEPHEVNPNNIDWRDEVRQMLELNVKVFPMQCLFRNGRVNVNKFWEEVSQISQTPLLMLESFGDSANALEAVAYASSGDAAYATYKTKFAAEVASGTRSSATNNLVDIQSNLETFSKTFARTESDS
jgi:Mg-chelatase subunit ChlD